MKITGLDGRYHKWNPAQSAHPAVGSKYHQRARILLEELFPFDNIYEEVILPGSGSAKDLIGDFVIPAKKLVIEVQGEQHYAKTFFHKTKMDFNRAVLRDSAKRRWCELNGLILVELPFSETDDEWKSRIVNR